jgi:hypothetical protein
VSGYYNSALEFVLSMQKRGVSIVHFDEHGTLQPIKSRQVIESIMKRNVQASDAPLDDDEAIFRS